MLPWRWISARQQSRHMYLALRCLLLLLCIPLMVVSATALRATPRNPASVALGVVDSRDIHFSHVSTRDGLSQSTVENILQDDRSFMWFGTQDGLNRFDGYAFLPYQWNSRRGKSSSGGIVTAALKDRSGILWVGMDDCLHRFNPVINSISRYCSDPTNPESIGGRVYSIAQDHTGNLWFGTSTGLDRFDPATEKFAHYRHDPQNPASLSAEGSKNDVTFVGEDRSCRLWVGTSSGLNIFNADTGKATRFPALKRTSEYQVQKVYEDRSGTIWILSTDAGYLATFKPETGELKRYSFVTTDPNHAIIVNVCAILEDEDGTLWFGTGGSGLIQFDRKHQRLVRYRHSPEDRNSLSNDFVLSLFKDREGDIWVGTGGGGVNRFSRQQQPFEIYRNDLSSPYRLDQNFVLSAYEDSHGTLWVGNDSVLNRIDRASKKVVYYRHNPADPQSISDGTVLSTTEDRFGTLWFGTYRGGLNRFNPGSGKFKSYRHRPGDAHSISSDVIFRVFESHDGTLWIGTDMGLDRFDPKTESFTTYLRVSKEARLHGIKTIAEGGQGELWLGTLEGGALRFNPANGKNVAYKYDPEVPGSLSSNRVNTIFVDRSGTVWLGTSSGLNRFDAKTGSFAKLFQGDGLANNYVHGILEDACGFLWISTNHGLSRFTPRTGTFTNYNVDDGLAGNEFNAWGAPFKSRRGELFFPGVDGLTAVFPERVHEDSLYRSPVVITDFRFFNTPVPVGGGSPLSTNISYCTDITLSHRQSTFFSLEFASLSYEHPMRNRYRYKLEGLDKDWNVTNSIRRFVSYTTLPAGEYVFRVQGARSSGGWSKDGVSLHIHILPAWWNTWSARLAMVTGFLFIMVSAYHWRIRAVHDQNRELIRAEQEIRGLSEKLIRAQDEERSRIARELHDDLNQQIASVSISVSGLKKKLINREAEEAEEADGILRRLWDLAGSVRQLSHQLHPSLLEAMGLEAAIRSYCLEVSRLSGVKILFDTAGAFENIPAALQLCLFRVTQEALQNVTKHANAKIAKVHLQRVDQSVQLSISDDGQGFAPAVSKFQGLGLISMRERVGLARGTLDLWSQPGQGTKVSVQIPIEA